MSNNVRPLSLNYRVSSHLDTTFRISTPHPNLKPRSVSIFGLLSHIWIIPRDRPTATHQHKSLLMHSLICITLAYFRVFKFCNSKSFSIHLVYIPFLNPIRFYSTFSPLFLCIIICFYSGFVITRDQQPSFVGSKRT